MRKRLLLTASIMLTTTACSGLGNASLGGADARPAARDLAVGQAVTPNALARKLIAKMPPLRVWHDVPGPTEWNSGPDETPQLNHKLPPGFKGSRAPLFATHYWEGVFTSPPPLQQSGIKALMTVYSDFYPPPHYIYYAPDMNGAGSDCLETYIAYKNSSAPAFRVMNWCGGSGLSKTINDTFVDEYVTAYHDLPVVYASSTTDDTGRTPTWHVKLYNYESSKWDDLLDQTGASVGSSGFSMFEAYRKPDGCPSVPTILAANIKIYSAVTGRYYDLNASNSAPNPEAACFTAKNGYDFEILDRNYTWEVTGGTP
jgi:hypothetical protein